MASTPFRQKVYVAGSRPGSPCRSPRWSSAATSRALRLYDTSGPGSDPERGLGRCVRRWITGRGDVEVNAGARQPTLRDDGRAAVRRGQAAPVMAVEPRAPLRAKPGCG